MSDVTELIGWCCSMTSWLRVIVPRYRVSLLIISTTRLPGLDLIIYMSYRWNKAACNPNKLLSGLKRWQCTCTQTIKYSTAKKYSETGNEMVSGSFYLAKYSMSCVRCLMSCTWSVCAVSCRLLVSFVYYGISFGVGRLTGNLYVNMFLVSVISLPSEVAVFFLNNRSALLDTLKWLMFPKCFI